MIVMKFNDAIAHGLRMRVNKLTQPNVTRPNFPYLEEVDLLTK